MKTRQSEDLTRITFLTSLAVVRYCKRIILLRYDKQFARLVPFSLKYRISHIDVLNNLTELSGDMRWEGEGGEEGCNFILKSC